MIGSGIRDCTIIGRWSRNVRNRSRDPPNRSTSETGPSGLGNASNGQYRLAQEAQSASVGASTPQVTGAQTNGSTGKAEDQRTALGYEDAEIIVGIPAYNEEVAIGSIVLKARQFADETVVVDDGSTDNTAQLAARTGATVISHEENRGKGVAINTLFEYASDRDWDALVLMDGDGQHAPDEIPQVAKPVLDGDADLVIGSRYLDEGGSRSTPRYRRIGQRVLDSVIAGSTQTDITDSQSGFRALSPDAVSSMNLGTNGFSVESEMIESAVFADLEVAEQSVSVRYDVINSSTLNPIRHGIGVLVFLVQLVRDRHPMVFFGLPGLIMIVGGVVFGADAITAFQGAGGTYPTRFLTGSLLTILGVVGLFSGLVLNQIKRLLARLD